MAHQEEHVSLGVEAEYTKCLLTVLPLFKSNLPCYNNIPPCPQEHELRNLLNSIHFEIQFLHRTLSNADAALSDAAFIGCAEVLKILLSVLESMLRDHTVAYLRSRLVPSQEISKSTSVLDLIKPRRLLELFGYSSPKNRTKQEDNLHVKIQALYSFLENSKNAGNEVNPTLYQDIDWLVHLPPKSEDLKILLDRITANNLVLEILLSTRIPSLQMNTKSQMRRQRRMKNPEYKARDLGNHLHETLAANCSSCVISHKTSLRLTPYWDSSFGAQETVMFNMFLSTHSEPMSWHEMMFITNKGQDEPSGLYPIKGICDLIEGLHQNTLMPCVFLHKNILFKSNSLRRDQDINAQPTLPLKTLLDEGHLKPDAETFNTKDKRILAVILAHCLLQFAEGPWMTNDWNDENIFFLHHPEDRKLLDIHRLYLSTQLGAAQESKGDDALAGDAAIVNQHALFRHPSIIAFGILLLEIEMGRKMQPAKEDCDPETGRPNINTAWTTADKMLKSPEICDRVYQGFRSVIEACLEPNKFLPVQMGFEDFSFREKVYEHIVAPLEDELLDGWPELELDSFGIEMDSLWKAQRPPVSRNIPQVKLLTPSGEFEQVFTPKPSHTHVAVGVGPGLRLGLPPPSLSSISHCSDAQSAVDPAICPFTEFDMSRYAWWKKFETTNDFMNKHRSGLSINPAPKRVKVAILDTGYSREDTLLREAQKDLPENIKFKDFVGNSRKPIDSSGHGTRVAYFLLQITTNIDIWIARVYEQDKGTAETAGRVKKAIEEATSLGVDIICMSLGFDKPVHEIKQAVLKANASGVLVFAAASNDRRLESDFQISFPASMDFGVLCINSHSSDQELRWSGFNPRYLATRNNFCVVGEDLYGPGSLSTASKNGSAQNVKLFEGTSYSTPIAVGIAALILEYSRSCKPLKAWIESRHGNSEPLKEFEIMRAIFKEMCNPTYMENRPNPVLPWTLLEYKEDYEPWEKIKSVIMNEGR